MLIFLGTDVPVKVGRRSRYSRFERGLSQGTPGGLSDRSRVDLSRKENGRAVASLRAFYRIALNWKLTDPASTMD
jgi:hypothetical protein